ncbi:MAG: tetratricopeptide repeat protein [Candidatus Cloacimonadota bacterium]|nr:tetratricopeptide repeat protein [Candidatus Cloacimonadota bacterium]
MKKKILINIVLFSLFALCISTSVAFAQEGKLAIWGFAYMDMGSRSMCKYLKRDFPRVAKDISGIIVIKVKTTDKVVGNVKASELSPNMSVEFANEVGADVAIWGMVSEIDASLYSLTYYMMNIQTEKVVADNIQIPKKRSDREKIVAKLIENASAMMGSAAQEKMDIALNFFNSKQYVDAKNAFLKVVELNPKDVSAYSYLGWICAADGNYEDGINFYQESLKLDPNYISALEGIAWAYKNNEQPELACETYHHLAEQDPEEIKYLMCVGEIWEDIGNSDEALETYTEIIEVDEDNVIAHKSIGSILFERDEYNEAIPHFVFVIDAGEDDGNIAKKLAVAYHKTDRIEECIEQNQKLIAKNPDMKTPYMNLAAIYVEQGNFDKAIQFLQTFIELDPDSKNGYIRIADVYRQNKNYPKAISNAQKAAEIASNDAGAFMVLAEIDNSRGYNHYNAYLDYDKKAKAANSETYDEFDKLRIENKKQANDFFISAKEYYKKALSLSTDFFMKKKLKNKIPRVDELIKATEPGFFDG